MATARSWYSQLLKSQETAREQNRREQRRLQLELDQKHGIEFAARYRVKELDREQRLVSKELDRIRKGVHKPLAHEYVVSSPADKRSPIIVVDHKSQVRYSHEETSLYKSMVFLQNNPSALIPLISAHSQTPGYFETLERLTPGLAPDPKTIFTPNYKAARGSLDERDQRGTKYSKLSYRKSPVLRKNSPLSMHRNSPLVNKSPTEEDIKDHDGSLKHAHRSSPVDLKHAHRSSPVDLKHAHRSSPVDLKHAHRSSPVDLRPAHRSSPVDLKHAHRSSPVDLKHAHRSSPVDLRPAHRLSPVDLKHAHRSSPVDLKHVHRSSPVGGLREETTGDVEVTQVDSELTKHHDDNINVHGDKTDTIDNKQAPETDSVTYQLIKTELLRNDEDLKLDLDLVDAGEESPMPEVSKHLFYIIKKILNFSFIIIFYYKLVVQKS